MEIADDIRAADCPSLLPVEVEFLFEKPISLQHLIDRYVKDAKSVIWSSWLTSQELSFQAWPPACWQAGNPSRSGRLRSGPETFHFCLSYLHCPFVPFAAFCVKRKRKGARVTQPKMRGIDHFTFANCQPPTADFAIWSFVPLRLLRIFGVKMETQRHRPVHICQLPTANCRLRETLRALCASFVPLR